MSKQAGTMPIVLNTFTRLTCAVFCTSSLTSFVLALLRLVKPDLFYVGELVGTDWIIHTVVCGMMLVTSTVGFINSCVMMATASPQIGARCVTTWLLLDSLFETCRVVYLFVCEVVLSGGVHMHTYDVCISCTQYFLDSFLYCQMILRH